MDLPPSGFTTQTDPAAIKASFENLRAACSELPGASAEVGVTADTSGLLTLPAGAASLLVTGNVNNIVGTTLRDGMLIILRSASALSIANAANTQPGAVLTEDGNALALNSRLGAILKYNAASGKWSVVVSSTLNAIGNLSNGIVAANSAISAISARFAQMPPSGNIVVNGNFDSWDAWSVFSESTTFAAALNGYSVDVSGGAGVNRNALVQIIESRDTIALRGQNAVLGYTLIGQSTYVVAVVEWTGAPDQPFFAGSRNPIANWNSANFAAGGFFSPANLLVSGVLPPAPATNAPAFLPVKVSSQANNLLIVFAEATPAPVGAKFNLSQVSLYGGSEQRAFYPQPFVLEQLRCARIKSLPFGS